MLIRPARSAATDKSPYCIREALAIGVPITISCARRANPIARDLQARGSYGKDDALWQTTKRRNIAQFTSVLASTAPNSSSRGSPNLP